MYGYPKNYNYPTVYKKGASAAASLVLDSATSTLWGAYGIKRLKTSYTGALIRVSSATATQADLGYDASGNLDQSTLPAGGAPYRLVKVYDQSGNLRDITYTAGAGGVAPVLDTSDVSLRFADNYMNLPDMSALTAGEIFVARKNDVDPSVAGNGAFWKMGTATANYVPFTDGNIYDGWGSTARKNSITHASSMAARHVYSVYSAANDWANYMNTTQLFTTATNTVGFTATPLIGREDTGIGSDYYQGRIYNIVIFSQKVTGTERTNIQTNL